MLGVWAGVADDDASEEVVGEDADALEARVLAPGVGVSDDDEVAMEKVSGFQHS